MRELERLAATGDPGAREALDHYMARTGKLSDAVSAVLRHSRALQLRTVRQIIEALLGDHRMSAAPVDIWSVERERPDPDCGCMRTIPEGFYGAEERAWQEAAGIVLEEDLVDRAEIDNAYSRGDYREVVFIFNTFPWNDERINVNKVELE
jgi:hypothetical protein